MHSESVINIAPSSFFANLFDLPASLYLADIVNFPDTITSLADTLQISSFELEILNQYSDKNLDAFCDYISQLSLEDKAYNRYRFIIYFFLKFYQIPTIKRQDDLKAYPKELALFFVWYFKKYEIEFLGEQNFVYYLNNLNCSFCVFPKDFVIESNDFNFNRPESIVFSKYINLNFPNGFDLI